MSNITDEFVAGPTAFLSQYVVFVANTAELHETSNKIGVYDFYFTKGSEVLADLKQRRFGSVGKTIRGYWLPWQTMKAPSMDLKSDADYFFTSQMTGCRFSVLTKEGEPPKVAHIAGTLAQGARTKAEDDLVKSMGGADNVRARRLSVSGASDHGYFGQTAKPSSAFVYGVRDKDSGKWSFAAQIVGLKMLPAIDRGTITTEAKNTRFTFDL
jgi:hypothetical protein